MRAIVATTDPASSPGISTWYLSTNMTTADAPLAEVVRLYGLRNWIEDHYKRVKDELGWADFMVRSDRAIRRHWTLVNCAFSFCWRHEVRQPAAQEGLEELPPKPSRSIRPPRMRRPRRGKKSAYPAQHWPAGRRHCDACAPGSRHGNGSPTAGRPGATSPCHQHSPRSWPSLPQAMDYTSTCVSNKVPIVTSAAGSSPSNSSSALRFSAM